MVQVVDRKVSVLRFPLPSLNEHADIAEKHGLETLLFCPNSWALRHGFVNQDTGEMARAHCNRWDCLYCGPRKVDQWRQLVKEAAPTLFLTLTKAGKTVEEAARALTTFLQYLRRGSKGKGPNHVDVREAYPIEYFAVLERHSNFEENGFHWHLLVKGAEFIPHEVLKAAWSSARRGKADIVWIEAIRKPQVIGYVTKYLTKSLSTGEKGVRYEERELTSIALDDEGHVVEERYTTTVEVVSKARRIRYSRHFFPEKVADLRARLFAELEQEAMEQTEGEAATDSTSGDEAGQEDDGKPVEDGPFIARSSWSLVEQAPFTRDIKEYRQRRRKALLERLTDLRAGQCHLSRRVISMWAYQRSESSWTG
jgi:hypothetical protein